MIMQQLSHALERRSNFVAGYYGKSREKYDELVSKDGACKSE
jgi:hypothetical protein